MCDKRSYMTPDELAYTPMPQVAEVVNCEKLNVRKSPSMESTILGILSKGDKVNVENVAGKIFYKVTVPGTNPLRGYCMKDYLKIVD